MKKKIFLCLSLMAGMALGSWAQAPTADLLDATFNEDGTATDASAMQNALASFGTPSVVFNEVAGKNVFDMTDSPVCNDPTGAFGLTVGTEMWNQMADGYSCELYLCPTFTSFDSWFSALGYQQSGGPGMIVDSGKWTFEVRTGGSYRESYTSAPVPNEWIHLLGVYDKANQKVLLYVNGKLEGQGDAPGDFDAPVGNNLKMFIGADTSGEGNPTNSFQGYIAVARIYSEVLTADQVAACYTAVTGENPLVKEAQSILDIKPNPNDFKNYPNFSSELRTQLQTALNTYQQSSTEENASALKEAIAKAKECQEAYIYMVEKANELLDYVDQNMKSQLTDAQYKEMENANDNVWAAFVDGTYSTEEALSLKDLKAVSYYDLVYGSMPEEKNGTYLVGNAAQMMWVARYVNAGHGDVNITLTADIDMTSMPTTLIANTRDCAFTGTLDGQGHTIKLAINVPNTGDYSGALIRYATNATVKNLNLTGSVTTCGKHCACVISYASGNITLENVSSDTDNYTNGGDACLAGLIGMGGENGNPGILTTVIFRNCAFTGSLNHTGNAGDSHGGPFIGWKGNSSSEVYLYSCFSAVKGSISNSGNYQSFVRTWGANDNGKIYVENSFFYNGAQFGGAQGEELSEEQFASGEAAYRMNGRKALNPAWYQKLGEDSYPSLDKTRGVVDYDGSKYYNLDVTDELTFALQGALYEAQNVLDIQPDADNYKELPNFSKTIRDELTAAVKTGESAKDAASKQAAIDLLTSLTEKAKASQKVYINAMDAAHKTLDFVDANLLNSLNQDQAAEYDELKDQIVADFLNGAYGDDAVDAVQKQLEGLSFYKYIYGVQPEFVNNAYQATCGEHLMWLAQQVQSGNNKINIELAADIDMSEMPYCMSIATSDNPAYEGTFDGKNHIITGFHQTGAKFESGFIGSAHFTTIKNFTLEGELILKAGTAQSGACIGDCWECNFENIHNKVNITIEEADVRGVGGIIGWVASGGTNIRNCTNEGKIIVREGAQYIGGIVGQNAGNAKIINCANYGTLISNDATTQLGGIVGILSNGDAQMHGCFNVGEVRCNASDDVNLTGALVGLMNSANVKNNVWLESSCKQVSGSTAVPGAVAATYDDFSSGSVCYTLNGGDFRNPVWFQTIGEDTYPVLDNTHGVVIGTEDTYVSITDEASVKNAASLIAEKQMEKAESLQANEEVLNAYKESIDALGACTTLDELVSAMNNMENSRTLVDENIALYKEFAAQAEDIKGKIEGNTSEAAEMLRTYLNGDFEPEEDYPNGGVLYIIDVMPLNTEQLAEEIKFMQNLHKKVAANDTPAGSDVTILLTNPTFADGFNGWDAKGGSAVSDLSLAECWDGTGEWSQSLTGLRNGYYEIDMNAGYRTKDSDEPTFYNAYLFAGENQTPVMLYKEDGVGIDGAENGVNCYIAEGNTWPYDRVYNEEMYCPSSTTGARIAFAAGRYLNRIFVKVTDGTLKFGITSLGGPLRADWITFANTKLIYWGEAAEATDGLDAVLAGQVARANTIQNAPFDSGDNYTLMPNFSQALRDQLATAIAAVETTTDNEAKYQLIQTFSRLFTEIRDCQYAYIHAMDVADSFAGVFAEALASGTISFEEYQSLNDKIQAVFMAFEEGSYSKEEAQAVNFYEGEMDGDFYVVKTPYDLTMISGLANTGKPVKVKLASDIDLSAATTLMLGNSQDAPFQGVFDGQGHTIKLAINVPNTGDYSGAFIRFATNLTVRNLNLTGSVTTCGKHCGSVISYGWGNVTLENVTSNTDNYTNGGDACLSGLVGMAGENFASSPTVMTFRNCAFTGTMNHTGAAGDSHGGVFVGWKGNNATTVYVYDSYSAAQGSIVNSSAYRPFVRLWEGGDNGEIYINNSYYYNSAQFGGVQGEERSAEKFASGEVCYLLNESQNGTVWRQDLGSDPYPVLDTTHGLVKKNNDGSYGNWDAILEVAEQQKTTDGIFNMMGQKVQKTGKGIYIINGKKTLLK